MSTSLIFILIFMVVINGLFTDISANFLEGYIYRGTATWTQAQRARLIFGIFLATTIPLAYLAYLEFDPRQSGVPTTPDAYFWVLVVPVAMISITTLVSYRPMRRLSIILIALITISVLISGLYFRRVVLRETRTVYFLIDFSEETKPYLQSDIHARMKLKVMSVPERVNLGLAVFGIGLEGGELCEDITELVQPSPRETAIPKMEEVLTLLDGLQARNISGVQESIAFAISQLETQRGIHQIVVMTTGPNQRCQTINKELLYEHAAALGVSFELVIIDLDRSVGEDRRLLEAAADRLFTITDENRDEQLTLLSAN